MVVGAYAVIEKSGGELFFVFNQPGTVESLRKSTRNINEGERVIGPYFDRSSEVAMGFVEATVNAMKKLGYLGDNHES